MKSGLGFPIIVRSFISILLSPLMSIKQSLLACAKFNVHNRIGRLEFFWFVLFELFVFWLVASVSESDYLLNESTGIWLKYFLLFFLLFAIWIMIAGLMLSMRRWHDIGFSGWWNILMLIPFLNIVAALYLLIKPGDPTINQYGMPYV